MIITEEEAIFKCNFTISPIIPWFILDSPHQKAVFTYIPLEFQISNEEKLNNTFW